MNKYKIFCAGKFIETGKVLPVRNPYNNEIFAETYLADRDILEQAIAKALQAESLMKDIPSHKKYNILMQIAAGLTEKKKLFAEIISMESAKPLKYSAGEVERAIQTFIIAAEEAKRLPKEYISLDWTPAGENREGMIKYFPIGLVAGIAPFNFPLNLAVHKLAPAIASGCPIILKPASSTPLSMLELSKILSSTSLPEGAVSVLPMDRVTGNIMVTDKRFKLLTFTGSPEVGWKMKENAGRKKVVLELGGNAGTIVTKSCDMKHALQKCLYGAFAYSGQVCIHAQRFFIAKEIFDEFISEFVALTKKLKPGNPMDADTDISSMIDEDNAIRVEEWVKEAAGKNAEILCGGKRKGSYVEPTVLTKTNNTMKVCSEEVFGPVVTMEKFTSFEEAVNMVNDTDFGLQAGVFTNNIDEMNYAFNNIEAGGVIINDVPTFRVDHMPYGGIKGSGTGREGVKYAIYDMMEPKIMVKGWSY